VTVKQIGLMRPPASAFCCYGEHQTTTLNGHPRLEFTGFMGRIMLLRIGQQNVKRAVHAVTIVHEGQEKEFDHILKSALGHVALKLIQGITAFLRRYWSIRFFQYGTWISFPYLFWVASR